MKIIFWTTKNYFLQLKFEFGPDPLRIISFNPLVCPFHGKKSLIFFQQYLKNFSKSEFTLFKSKNI
jgi:hypothetical protein